MGSPTPVQISTIAGRYLVFSHDDISLLRRHYAVCGVLTGTVPQSPTQNLFLGVPLELRLEDVVVLLEAGVATVRDEAQTQLAVLRKLMHPVRDDYVASIKLKRQAVERAYHDKLEKKNSAVELSKSSAKGFRQNRRTPSEVATCGSQAQNPPAPGMGASNVKPRSCSVSPTVVGHLRMVPPHSDATTISRSLSRSSPLHGHLTSKHFFMTPGLRFGARFSAYPGDPFRYHAHYLANDYKWDEEIPLLEMVGAGRLSTAVKKGFLAGSEGATSSCPNPRVRVFCIEWAGM